MTDGAPPLSSLDELLEVWDRFRTGGTATCPTDGFPMALSVDGTVDGTVGIYRLVCTRCGTASPWFEAGAGGMTLRAGPGKAPPPGEG